MGDGLTFGERLKKWYPPRKLIAIAFVTVVYGLMYWWISGHQVGYFQQWLARQAFWEYWVVAVAMISIGLWVSGATLAAGCAVGIPIAQYLGDQMDAYYATIITPDMTAEELAAYGPRHAYMWWMIVVSFVVIGLIIQLVLRILRKRKEAMMPW